jgi:predicted transcriptional regulator
MRVGIFETTHFEGAYPVIKCFDNGANEITIFCYEESYRQFQHLFEGQMEKFSWVVKSQQDSKYKFIYRIYKETKSRKLDLLYLNTISDISFFMPGSYDF